MHKAIMIVALLHVLALIAIGARLYFCAESARARALAWTQGHVCEGHGRGNYPFWSDDGRRWYNPPNMKQLEAM